MSDDKIQLQHPEGKKLPQIDRAKYDAIHAEMTRIISEVGEIKPTALLARADENLQGKVEGNIAWYAESIKLDMEAKGEIVHDRKRGIIYRKEGEQS